MERLYTDRAISFEEYDAARARAEVDVDEVAKRAADLALVKTGRHARQDRGRAGQARSRWCEEKADAERQGRCGPTLRMPFDGNILTLHLNERLNSVLDRGQPFATVENTRSVTAEIQVPESEVGYVAVGAPIRARPNGLLRPRVHRQGADDRPQRHRASRSATCVKVIAVIDNPNGELKTGMTGYAKIGGTTMPVWKAFSLALLRFLNIQVWSWIP